MLLSRVLTAFFKSKITLPLIKDLLAKNLFFPHFFLLRHRSDSLKKAKAVIQCLSQGSNYTENGHQTQKPKNEQKGFCSFYPYCCFETNH